MFAGTSHIDKNCASIIIIIIISNFVFTITLFAILGQGCDPGGKVVKLHKKVIM